MSFQVKLNSVDVTSRVISGPNYHKNDVFNGKISSNECSFELENTQISGTHFTVSDLDIEGQAVEVWIDSDKKFTGVAEKPVLSLNGRKVQIKAVDALKKLKKKKCQDKVYTNSTIDTILTWLLETVGGLDAADYNADSVQVPTSSGWTQATTGFKAYKATEKLGDALQEIVDSCGGSMWIDGDGVLQFRAGFASTWSTSTVGTITVSNLKDIESLTWLPSEGDRVIVKSKNQSVKKEKEPIFTWSGTVPKEGYPDGLDENGNAIADDDWKAKFDSVAIDVDDYSTVNSNAQMDTGLTLDETVYNSNFESGDLKYPDYMYLQINNSTEYEKNVTELVINGKPVVENYLEVIYDAGSWDVEREIQNDLISSKVWAQSLAKWLYEQGNDKFEMTVPIADFDTAVAWEVGNKVNIVESTTGLSHRAWIRKIDVDYRKRSIRVTLRSDRDSAFTYTGPGNSTTGPGSNITIDDGIGDGAAPATPTGLSLTSFTSNGKSYVKATWDENSESDFNAYELRWSYDDADWNNAGSTTNEEIVIEVTNQLKNTDTFTVYVQIRATDIEKLKSNWSSSVDVEVQADTSVPSTPSSVSATGGVGLIYVNWSKIADIDLDYYILERCVQTSDGGAFSSWSVIGSFKTTDYYDENVEYHIQDSDDPNYPQWRKYKYRVKAVDYAGNESSYTSETTARHAVQATGDDIAVNAITANHIQAITIQSGKYIRAGDANSEYYEMRSDGFKYGYNSQPTVEWVKVRMKLNNVLDGVSWELRYSNDGGTTWASITTTSFSSNGWNERESDYNIGGTVINDLRFEVTGRFYEDPQTEIEQVEIYIKTNQDDDYVLIATIATYEDWQNVNLIDATLYDDAGRAYIKGNGTLDAGFVTPDDWYIYNAGEVEYKVSSIISSGTIEFNGHYIEKKETLPAWTEDYEVVLIPIYQQVAKSDWYTAQTDQFINTEVYKSGRSFTVKAYSRNTPYTEFQKEPEEKGYGSWNVMANVTNCKTIEFDIVHWGLYRVYRGHFSHEYDTAYTGAITWYQAGISSNVLVNWTGGTTADKTIDKIVGGAIPRNMTVHKAETETPIKALYRYLVLKSPA
jgi:hypothetical protein